MATNPPADSDPIHGSLGDDPTQQVITPLQRAAAWLFQTSVSNANQATPPAPSQFLRTTPAKVFGSPLALSGSNVVQGVRVVTSGWGDGRAALYGNAAINGTRKHGGLDFRAPDGETILASADGKVTFVGYQRRAGSRVSVARPHTDGQGNVLNADGKVVAAPSDLGHGGVYVEVTHFGDFSGWKTQYMHCSDTLVKQGDTVYQGNPIAKVGQSGGNDGVTTGPHLHWQARFFDQVQNPTFLVPHYRQGHELVRLDGTSDSATAQASVAAIQQSKPQSVGEAVMTLSAAGVLQGIERTLGIQQKTHQQIKQDQAGHAQLQATNLSVHPSALYDAVAKFNAAQPEVQGGMSFNYDTGLWSDQDSAPKPGTGV